LELSRFIVDVQYFKDSIRKGTLTTRRLLRKEEGKAEREGKFNAGNILDSRKRIAAYIVARRGQPAFRKKLLKAYGGRCAVSGCDCPEALEAAHIRPYLGEETDHITNGLLLRSDLHVLFDLHLVSVAHGNTMVTSRELRGTVYEKLKGKILHLPKDANQRSDLKVLAEHCAE